MRCWIKASTWNDIPVVHHTKQLVKLLVGVYVSRTMNSVNLIEISYLVRIMRSVSLQKVIPLSQVASNPFRWVQSCPEATSVNEVSGRPCLMRLCFQPFQLHCQGSVFLCQLVYDFLVWVFIVSANLSRWEVICIESNSSTTEVSLCEYQLWREPWLLDHLASSSLFYKSRSVLVSALASFFGIICQFKI